MKTSTHERVVRIALAGFVAAVAIALPAGSSYGRNASRSAPPPSADTSDTSPCWLEHSQVQPAPGAVSANSGRKPATFAADRLGAEHANPKALRPCSQQVPRPSTPTPGLSRSGAP